MQEEQSRMNKRAWNTKSYDAWLRLYGTPSEIARAMVEHPLSFLRHFPDHIGEIKGKRIANLCGSHGRRAIPLALMGADVTVVDISDENKRFAEQVAMEAGAKIEYIVEDVMKLPQESMINKFDVVLMEFGILHYFSDLNQLFSIVASLLKSGGRYILTDFHPFLKTLEDGDYFDETFQLGGVAYHEYMSAEEQKELNPVMIRRYRMGEIVTAIADSGLVIRKLLEEPHKTIHRIPSNYTLVSDKLLVERR